MGRQNRVLPSGEIVAGAERGTLLGNRGVLHDERGRIVRPWQLVRWIACETAFRGRWRPPLTPRTWTALYFLDEATALAAGHRPCAQCRHADFQRFRAAWAATRDGGGAVTAAAIDRQLHGDRLADRRTKRTYEERLGALPDGALVSIDGAPWLVRGDELRRWSLAGYGEGRPRPTGGVVSVLTPRSAVTAIRAGYEPRLHASASASG